MKVLQLGLAAFLLVVASCATGVGEWDGGTKGGDVAALRAEVRDSLTSSSWVIIQDTDKLAAVKAGSGGHRTVANFTFSESASGPAFHLRGASHHRFNWATFGILGLSMRNQAGLALTQWYEAWIAKHPRD